jgi:hypothetical protein
LRKPEEILKIIQRDDTTPSYRDLSTFTREEWEQFKLDRADGARPKQAGEGQIAEEVLDRRRKRVNAANKKLKRKVEDWNEIQSSENDSGKDEDVRPQPSASGPRDADSHEQTLFDGPFAVVVPTTRT